MANTTTRFLCLAGALPLLLCLVACGGEDKGRATEKPARGVLPEIESRPIDCSIIDDYELTVLDDFELGAARGSWYTNNDVCSRCQQLTQEIERLEGEIAGLQTRVGELESLLTGNLSQEQIDAITGQAEIASLEQEIDELTTQLEDDDLSSSERASLQELINYNNSRIDELEAQVEYLSDDDNVEAAIADAEREIEANQDEIADVEAGNGQIQLTSRDNLDPTKGIAVPTGSLESCLAQCEIVQSPSFSFRPIPAALIENGRCGSSFALNMRAGHPSTGAEPLNLWGGVMGFQFSPPLDAGDYEGVAFWGRVGNQSRQSYRVQLTEKHTDESYRGDDGPFSETGGLVAPGEQGSICNPQTALGESDTGCDKFGNYVINTHDWQFFRLPFSEMRQSGWGRTAEYFDTEGILSIVFSYEVGSWNIWIDDVALYKRRN